MTKVKAKAQVLGFLKAGQEIVTNLIMNGARQENMLIVLLVQMIPKASYSEWLL